MTLTANLAGKRALITGASSGLGRHFAHVLARAGASVVLAARNMTALQELADTISASGGTAHCVHLDVCERQSVDAAIAQALTTGGPLDLLVNNSGVTASAPVLEQTDAQWDTVIDVNLRGAFLVATAVARHLRDVNRGGSIINIASILGLRQAGHVAGYAVSKAGLVQLTKVLALELAQYSIRVNAIAPGYIETPMNEAFWGSPASLAMVKRIPQRRLGSLADLDGALLLLASDASAYMTGTVLAVDGGHLVSGL